MMLSLDGLFFSDRSRPPGFKSSMKYSNEDLPSLENSTGYLSVLQGDRARLERKGYLFRRARPQGRSAVTATVSLVVALTAEITNFTGAQNITCDQLIIHLE
jgi:hypothetical protein